MSRSALRPVAQLSPRRIANKAEAAEFFNVTVPAINEWINQGAPVIERGAKGVGWKLDLLELAKWRFVPHIAPAGEGGEVDPDRLAPRERKDWYDSELRRSQLAERNGELIPVLTFQREMSAVIKAVVAGLQTLPDRLERDAGLTGDAIERAQAIIDTLRDELHAALTKEAG